MSYSSNGVNIHNSAFFCTCLAHLSKAKDPKQFLYTTKFSNGKYMLHIHSFF